MEKNLYDENQTKTEQNKNQTKSPKSPVLCFVLIMPAIPTIGNWIMLLKIHVIKYYPLLDYSVMLRNWLLEDIIN